MTATEQPIEVLIGEHRIIQRVLVAMEMMGRDLDGRRFPETFFDLALEFLSQYADHCHQAKEEERLFPLLWEKGVPLEKGPLGPLMAEHERARRQLNAMRLYVDAVKQGKAEAVPAFQVELAEFLRSMREQLEKEEVRVFNVARTLLTPADWERLRREFDDVEHESMGKAFHARYEGLADRLSEVVPHLRQRSGK
jgi:hemerythrin-like domain-containing protein